MPTVNPKSQATHSRELSLDRPLISEINTAVIPELNSSSILNQLADTMLNVLDATSVYIADWHTETGFSTVIAESYGAEASDQEKISDLDHAYNLYELHDSLKWLNKDTPYFFHIDDPDVSDWDRQHMEEYGCKTTLIIPLKIYTQTFGYAEIWESRQKRDFTEKEVKLAGQLAQQASIMLLNAQLYLKEAKRRRESEIVQEIAGYLTSTLNLDEVLTRVIDIMRSYLANVQSCTLTVLEKDGRFLKKYKGWSEKEEYAIFANDDGIWLKDAFASRLAISQKEPIAISDLQKYPFTDKRTQSIVKRGLRAILYVPLLIREEPIGLMHISVWEKPRQFTREEIALTQAVANQAAIAIENANLFAAERHQLKLAQTIQQVGALLTTSITLEEVYERIFDLLENVVSYTSVSVQLIDEKTQLLFLAASRGFDNIELIKASTTKHSYYLTKKIPMPPGWAVIPDTTKNDLWVDNNIKTAIRSWIGVGLLIKDRMIGILNVDHSTPNVYDEAAGQTVAIFANQAAIAIENARLHDKTRQQAEEVAILHLLAQTTAVTLNIDKLLHQTTELIAQKRYPHIFGFMMVNEENNTLYPHPSVHGISSELHDTIIPIDNKTIIGNVVLTNNPFLSNDVQSDPRYMAIDPRTVSEIIVPVIIKNKVIGLINAQSPEKNAFNQKDYDFLMTLSVNVAAAIERAQLYNALSNQAADLTGQVAAQTMQLQAERDRTLAILESAGEGILLTDINAIIEYANPAMEKQSGYSREELIGQTPNILDSGTNKGNPYEEMWQAIARNNQWAGELRNMRKDGSLYDVSIVVSPLKDKQRRISGYVTVHSDISRLVEVDRLKAEFISNISHELRTPLTSIRMYLSLLEKGKQENFPRYISVLNQESERLGRLIQGLLEISRLETTFVAAPDTRLEIRPYLTQFIDALKTEADNKQITIQIIWPDDNEPLPDAVVEEEHFKTIINNTLENAIRFSPANKEITISTGSVTISEQAFIWIRIQDQGWGIPQTEKDSVYERFFRGQAAYDHNIPGSGLGLAIVKETIDGYNGRISLTSEEDKGSTFTIWLPASQPSNPSDQ